MVLIAGAGLLQVADYSMTYYALHFKPYFYEMGLVGSWALSHGNIGWYLMGLFDFLMLLFLSALAVFSYRRYKTPLLPLVAFVSLYVSGIYAVTHNALLLIRGSL
jgi:hypothetical protein